MAESESQRFDLRALVNVEAWQDPQFKEQLQQDPSAAVRSLAEKYQLDLPNINYRLNEDTDDTYTLVLTPSPAGPAPEAVESEVQGYIAMFTSPMGDLGGGTVGGRCSSAGSACHSPVCTAVLSCRPISSLSAGG